MAAAAMVAAASYIMSALEVASEVTAEVATKVAVTVAAEGYWSGWEEGGSRGALAAMMAGVVAVAVEAAAEKVTKLAAAPPCNPAPMVVLGGKVQQPPRPLGPPQHPLRSYRGRAGQIVGSGTHSPRC